MRWGSAPPHCKYNKINLTNMPLEHQGKHPQQIIRDMKQALKRTPLLVGNLAVRHFKQNMDNESWEGNKWPVRNPRAARNEGRKLLRDTGTLYRAITKYVAGEMVKVFVAAPADKYAETHNEGGILKVKVTAQMRKWAWAMYYKNGGAYARKASKTMGERSTWSADIGKGLRFWRNLATTKKSELSINIPRRQFMGDSPALRKEIAVLIETIINEVTEGK